MAGINFGSEKKILLTGGAGFLGKFIVKELCRKGVEEKNIFIPRSRDYDLRQKEAASQVLKGIDIVIHSAAAVGGIGFNQENPAEVFYDNACMTLNLIDEAYKAGAQKFIGIGSVVEYPAKAPLPFKETDIWQGAPEAANASYALAKRFMLAQSQMYRAQFNFNAIHLLPVKLYGAGMSFDEKKSQVISAVIKKIHEAKKSGENFIELWGTGLATREFMYVEDAAEAIVLAAEKYDAAEPLNIGTGVEVSIKELVETIARLMNFSGELRWNPSKPEGQARSVADINAMRQTLGYTPHTGLEDGLRKTLAGISL